MPNSLTPSLPLAGVLVLDKPAGMTSMTAVAKVRRRAGRVKTGHAGTLDPLATGVLVLALGKATKLIDQFMATAKRYHTTIDLSAFTATDDAEGERQEVAVADPPTERQVREACSGFIGEILQRPPQFSAMKIGGRRAYKAARSGQTVDLPERPVTIHEVDLVRYEWPMLELEVHCAKGVYIRSLARDLGSALGTGGYCRSIRRTAVGPFTLEMAKTLGELPDVIDQTQLIAPDAALGLLRPST